eukprot:gene15448-20842_t
MDQILNHLVKIKSIWQLFYELQSDLFGNWTMVLQNLVPLFRKDTFKELNSEFYPKVTPNCRYYIKPNDGAGGKGILIVNELQRPLAGYTITPEIITPLINGMKYDYRVWIGITGNLDYFICPTFIKRKSTVAFDITSNAGSLTNLSLYSVQENFQDVELYNHVHLIVHSILHKLTPVKSDEFMLTGWDFIHDCNHELFVLEVNCNPGVTIEYMDIMIEFLDNYMKL